MYIVVVNKDDILNFIQYNYEVCTILLTVNESLMYISVCNLLYYVSSSTCLYMYLILL